MFPVKEGTEAILDLRCAYSSYLFHTQDGGTPPRSFGKPSWLRICFVGILSKGSRRGRGGVILNHIFFKEYCVPFLDGHFVSKGKRDLQ